jgi:ribosome-associated toxin RatA of RatAB toxin-antitoxin module
MAQTSVTRTINASAERVFNTVADIRHFSQAIPHIKKFEFLTAQQSGVGTRFLETSVVSGKPMTFEMLITEYEENDHVRIVNDFHGVIWDSVFSVQPRGAATELTLVMDARPYRLLPRLLNPIFRPMIRKAMEKDMDLVKAFCEQAAMAA